MANDSYLWFDDDDGDGNGNDEIRVELLYKDEKSFNKKTQLTRLTGTGFTDLVLPLMRDHLSFRTPPSFENTQLVVLQDMFHCQFSFKSSQQTPHS